MASTAEWLRMDLRIVGETAVRAGSKRSRGASLHQSMQS
jgi:hypothetical protein